MTGDFTPHKPAPDAYPNPFERLEKKIDQLSYLLHGIAALAPSCAQNTAMPVMNSDFIPVQELFKNKYCSKPTFYTHVKNGLIPLYKLGNRSFVKADEFHNAFRKVNARGLSSVSQKGGVHV